jgi:glycosyltransferase involved in cell wall biosynthesis
LPRLLSSVEVAREIFAKSGGSLEIIVADNTSTDGTAEVARSFGCRVISVERRIIAAARNCGARAATASIIAFVDADLQIHPQTFVRIQEEMSSGRYLGGASGWRLERTSLGLRATVLVTRIVTRILKVGGGVVFCIRDAFDAIGGYNEAKYVAEDVQFMRDLRKLGRARGQTLCLDIGADAIVSTRKFDLHGDWHMFFMLSWPIFQRRSMSAVIHDYWYSEKR